MDHLNLGSNAIQRRPFRYNISAKIEVWMYRVVSSRQKAARGAPARLFVSFNRRDQLAARKLTLPSASELSFLSAVFSSSSVFCRMLAQSLRPSCRAHAIRLP